MSGAALGHASKNLAFQQVKVLAGMILWREAVRGRKATGRPQKRPLAHPSLVCVLPRLAEGTCPGGKVMRSGDLGSLLGKAVSELISGNIMMARGPFDIDGVARVSVEESDDEVPKDAGVALGGGGLDLKDGRDGRGVVREEVEVPDRDGGGPQHVCRHIARGPGRPSQRRKLRSGGSWKCGGRIACGVGTGQHGPPGSHQSRVQQYQGKA